MHDAHVHLDFMESGEQVATDAAAAGTMLFANTVTPEGWEIARKRFAGFDNVRVGWGMHPWWVESIRERPAIPSDTRFIGEVGLDFGKKYAATRDAQLQAFTSIAQACALQGGKVVSIHSVHAAHEVLDVLESSGAAESCACIFHWFTGPSDQLKRAVMDGCFFSVGPRMVATGKGREYVKAIPAKQLLLETDAPPGQSVPYSFAELSAELTAVVNAVAAIKGSGVLEVVDSTFENLFL